YFIANQSRAAGSLLGGIRSARKALVPIRVSMTSSRTCGSIYRILFISHLFWRGRTRRSPQQRSGTCHNALSGPVMAIGPTQHLSHGSVNLRNRSVLQCSPCMSSRSDEYRQKAVEAKNRAAQTSSRPIKRAFQEVARNWLLLAEQMEWLDRQGSSRRDE